MAWRSDSELRVRNRDANPNKVGAVGMGLDSEASTIFLLARRSCPAIVDEAGRQCRQADLELHLATDLPEFGELGSRKTERVGG